jgi:hypothetical protein
LRDEAISQEEKNRVLFVRLFDKLPADACVHKEDGQLQCSTQRKGRAAQAAHNFV